MENRIQMHNLKETIDSMFRHIQRAQTRHLKKKPNMFVSPSSINIDETSQTASFAHKNSRSRRTIRPNKPPSSGKVDNTSQSNMVNSQFGLHHNK